MENDIKYFYNIDISNLQKNGTNYIFEYSGDEFLLFKSDGNKKNIEKAKKIADLLNASGIQMHQLILNKFNNYISIIKNEHYVLMKFLFSKQQNNEVKIFFYKIGLGKCEWKNLWIKKLDYYEKLLSDYGNKYNFLREKFEYYAGMAEIGIAMIPNIECNVYYVHYRITNDFIDYYNPFNITFDVISRDFSEYIKLQFINMINKNKLDIKMLYDYILSFLAYMDETEKKLFLARLFYFSPFFDLLDNINNGFIDKNLLQSIIKHTKEYESLLLYVYNQIDFYIKLPSVYFSY